MKSVGTYFLKNFGCRATQADGAAIERQLLERGLTRAVSPGQAEVVVLNTCTVTASADQDVRSAIRRIHRNNPDTRILVTGCYAQRAPEEIAGLDGVAAVVGNSHKALAPEIAVNAVAPGMIDLGEKSAAAFMRRMAKQTPMQRNGRGDEIAAAVLFFATAPQFITGQILAVDGGLGL